MSVIFINNINSREFLSVSVQQDRGRNHWTHYTLWWICCVGMVVGGERVLLSRVLKGSPLCHIYQWVQLCTRQSQPSSLCPDQTQPRRTSVALLCRYWRTLIFSENIGDFGSSCRFQLPPPLPFQWTWVDHWIMWQYSELNWKPTMWPQCRMYSS